MTLLSPSSPAVAVIILLRTAVGSTPIRESWLVIDWERPKIHP
jgi:hypothetical protein